MDKVVKHNGVGWASRALFGTIATAIASSAGAAADGPWESELSTLYYSTAAPPRDYPGAGPIQLALLTPEEGDPPPNDRVQPTPAPVAPAAEPPAASSSTRSGPPPVVATVPRQTDSSVRPRLKAAAAATVLAETSVAAETDPIAFAKQAIADCRTRYAQVQDYTCTFHKRERIDGRLSDYHIMAMKARARPLSIYFKFQQPNTGREAIYVAGKFGGHVLAHDVGIGKVLAGTLNLDPNGFARAMEGCLHPITDAGIGHLIETVSQRWGAEMKQGETEVAVHPNAKVGTRACTLIESTHPQRSSRYLFYRVKVYIDHEHGLPIHFEAYDWPRRPGEAAELVEEYTYMNLRLNTGLTERDFDPANKQYSFGRF